MKKLDVDFQKQPYSRFDETRAQNIASALLQWYDEHARDLPWRRSRDPYKIWVSEIMAQQTRMTALLPYYERFMERFPSVEALAAADVDEVLKLWEGLGYYSRAHNLHKAAQLIVERHGGRLPDCEKTLRSLPGIGEYTAGAVLSIAFDRPVPAIDGNVLRVFSRLECNAMDIAQPATKSSLSAYVRTLIPLRAGAFAQAVMELGALVCTSRSPSCGVCPVASLCKAFDSGVQHELPVKARKTPQHELEKTVLMLCADMGGEDHFLMRRRPEKLLRGLWVFDLLDGACEGDEIEEHIASRSLTCDEIISAGRARHVFTHLIWDMNGYFCRVRQECAHVDGILEDGWQWVSRKRLDEIAMPVALDFYRVWLRDYCER